MPYDLQTPFGTIPGQVSPYEQLQAQTAGRMRSQAAADDAASAQLHMLKQAIGGQGSGSLAEDPFFNRAGPDTGAVDMAARNAAVMQRQMGQADMDANAFRSTGLDAGTRERLAQGAAKLERGQMDIQGSAQDVLKSTLQDYLNEAGGKTAGMNPNLPGNPNALVGGAGPSPNVLVGGAGASAAPAGRSSDEQLMKLAILQSIASGGKGGGIGDVLKNRDSAALENRKFDMTKQEHDLAMQKAQAEMLKWQKDMADQESLSKDPTAVSAKFPEVTTPLSQQVQQFVAQDTKMIGWDPTTDDMDAIAKERDRAAAGLAKRGLNPQQALQEANRVIVNSLGANRNDINSGATKKMLARLGITSAAPAQAPDAIDPNAMNYGPGM